MKSYFQIFLLISILSACTKEEANTEILRSDTSPVSKIISSDTLRTGSFWELTIGDSSFVVYQTLQKIHIEKKVHYLGIVANSFNKLEDIANRITLYTGLDLDEQKGTETGVQVEFEANKIKSIYLNNGTKLDKWPSNSSTTIAVQDQIDQLYPKLRNIQSNALFARKFERISLFRKDINKIYDPIQVKSPQWNFTVTGSDKILYAIYLNFSTGILSSIYITKYQL
ncbi:MAG: hypothetical protein IBJ16_03595 [Chitinophagaceae bacterium]|nr:hypothetical protein [Chitinophagaceae bacterium]